MIILQKAYRAIFLLLFLMGLSTYAYSHECPRNTDKDCKNTEKNSLQEKSRKKHKKLTYYLYTADFISSFIEIPTSNVSVDSSTISSKYLAGRAPVYNCHNQVVGTCSASFLCMQNSVNILSDISNYLSIDNGLIVSWFTPSTLINLELDSIVHSMVTECIVRASTKIGYNPFYGKKYNMVVSSDQTKIYFKLTEI